MTVPEGEPQPEMPGTGRPRSPRRVPAGLRMPFRVRVFASLVLVTAIVATLAWTTPAVRLEVRRSFTQVPSEFTELYFTQKPALERSTIGFTAVVPLSIVRHGTHPHTYGVVVSIATASGHIRASSTIRLGVRPGVPTPTVIRLPAGEPADASGTEQVSGGLVVFVALPDQQQRLHYRLTAEDRL